MSLPNSAELRQGSSSYQRERRRRARAARAGGVPRAVARDVDELRSRPFGRVACGRPGFGARLAWDQVRRVYSCSWCSLPGMAQSARCPRPNGICPLPRPGGRRVGVPSDPRGAGTPMIRTATAAMNAKPAPSQKPSVASDSAITIGTNTPEMRSASRCTGALPVCASLTRRAIWARRCRPRLGRTHDQPPARVDGYPARPLLPHVARAQPRFPWVLECICGSARERNGSTSHA